MHDADEVERRQGTLFDAAPVKRRRQQAPPPPLTDLVAEVALPVPLDQTFHYRIPESMLPGVAAGARVRVPFGRRRLVGVCLRVLPLEEAEVAPGKLRAIEKALDERPAFPPTLLELCRFTASYYRTALGEVLQAALPAGVKRRVRSILSSGVEAPAVPLESDGRGGEGAEPLELTEGQARALELILEDVERNRFGVTLVHGITGSGKTETYLRAVEAVRARGRRALVLVPEIALTHQLLGRFEKRLGPVGVLHSLQSPRERAVQWERARNGEVDVVVGPRSAVFAPLENLGLICVDEEHDGGFKQQDQAPRYSARDLAVVRARIEGAACILGSATPSLESQHNAQIGRYRLAYLGERPLGAVLPRVEVVDLREETREVKKGFPFLSRLLVRYIGEALDRGEQIILFLNRRGFATFIQCRGCREVLTCGQCDVALTYHKARGQVICHSCDVHLAPPSRCPVCEHPQVTYFGLGTEKVEEHVRGRFPDAVVRRVDSDAISGIDALQETLSAFERGEAQILIGTQMVAKGLDFANVSVVGVISADTGLNMPDFRAAERTFQLLAQVAGRAGRGSRPGVTVIQTFSPMHPAVQFAAGHDVKGFSARELIHREKRGYPPFGRLARIVLSGRDERETRRQADDLFGYLRSACVVVGPQEAGLRILGPAPCPIALIRGRHRVMLLLKAPDRATLAPALDAIASAPRPPRAIRVALDVDPLSML